jgi:hypothetical protein
MDYDKRLKRAEQEIKVLRLKKRLMQGNEGLPEKKSSPLFWIFLIIVVLFILYSTGIIDVSSMTKYFKK